MDEKLIEGMRRMNQIGAWETYGKDAIAVVSQGTPGEYADNPTVKEYERTKDQGDTLQTW